MKLILLRHGQSEWNLENRFTGWHDIKLTLKGVREARFSGNALIKNNFQIRTIYTSLLTRAIETANIVSDIINFDKNEIKYEWRLNERHYGALQGLNKSDTAEKYGENQVKIWRRSFDVKPPLLSINDSRHAKFNDKFNFIKNPPIGESLQDVITRLNPFWDRYLPKIQSEQGDHLIVAHSNSLRAVVKILDCLNDKEIMSVDIPTGVPLVYYFDEKNNIINKEYLIDIKKLKKLQNVVKNQGKVSEV